MARVLSILENIPMTFLGVLLLSLAILFPPLGVFLVLALALFLLRDLAWVFRDSPLYFWGIVGSFGATASYFVWEYRWFLQFLWSPFLDRPSIPYWILYTQEGIACLLSFFFGALVGWAVHKETTDYPPKESPFLLPLFLTWWVWYDGWVGHIVTYRDNLLGIDLTQAALKWVFRSLF